MTIRVDSVSLITGKTVVSLFSGHGIQAQNIPSTGDSGPSFLFNDIAAQGMSATDEVRGELLTWPSAGTLTVNEDSSFSFAGVPDGDYSFTYRGFRNGVSYGDYTVSLTIGGESVTATISGGLPVPAASVSVENLVPVFSADVLAGLPVPTAAVVATIAGSNNLATIAAGLPVPVASAGADLILPIYQATISAGLPVPTAIAYASTGERQIFISADRMAVLPSYSRNVAL